MLEYDTITGALRARAACSPERTFCHLLLQSGGQSTLSFGELLSRACRYAALYRQAGLQPGDTVSIVLDLSEDLLAAFVGAQLGGQIPSYLAPPNERQSAGHYWQQLQAQCHRIERGLILGRTDLAGLLQRAAAGSSLVLKTPQNLPADAEAAPAFTPAPEDIALLQHSSGTTGSRKGVALSHRAILQQVDAYAQALRLRDDDVIVSWLPLYHDMGLITSLLMPLATGTPVVMLDPLEWVAQPALLLDAITRHRGTLCWLPNFAFHFLARVPLASGLQLDLSSMRAFVNCSEPCKPEAFDVFLRRFATVGVRREQLQVCYAMAETVFAVTQTQPGLPLAALAVSREALLQGRISDPAGDEDRADLMPVGAAVPGAQVAVLDDDGAELPAGRVGEICISAPFLFDGYFREPELTQSAMRDGRYLSGDLGAQYRGQLYVTGRKKDLIIVNGKNFYAHDIEAAVNSVPGVHPGRCVAFGVYQAETGSEAVHVVAESGIPQAGQPALARDIKEAVQRELGLVVARAEVVADRWLVKTTSGKVSRRDNRRKYLERMGTAATLERIQEVMRFVFMNDGLVVSAQTTALDVDGWDSLAHSMLVLELEEAFGVELDIQSAATCADIGELAALIEGAAANR